MEPAVINGKSLPCVNISLSELRTLTQGPNHFHQQQDGQAVMLS